jgi:uncharacterized surface protein with fasciclin (FAS1) repeats
MVIGESGVQFFRDFAVNSCAGGALIEGNACDDVNSSTSTPPAPPAPPSPPPFAYDAFQQHRDMSYYSPEPPRAQPAARFGLGRRMSTIRSLDDYIRDPKLNAELGFTADALLVTGLRGILDENGDADDRLPMTVFAPTNEAWYTLLFRSGLTKEDLFNDRAGWLESALKHHVVPGRIVSTGDMRFGTTHTTALGAEDRLTTETFAAPTSNDAAARTVRVDGCTLSPTRRDIFVGDVGIVHYIDCVLMPFGATANGVPATPATRTIEQYVVAHPAVSAFANAARGRGLFSRMQSSTNGNDKSYFTVFVPRTEAFLQFMQDPRVGSIFYAVNEDDSRALDDVLAYHVVHGFHPLHALARGRASKTYPTLLTDTFGESNQPQSETRVFVDVVETHKFGNIMSRRTRVNGCEILGEPAFTSDGVVYIIDCVLVPELNASI